ncbi:MAG: O-antigen ligase family protein [Thermoleophilaceae bacterium]
MRYPDLAQLAALVAAAGAALLLAGRGKLQVVAGLMVLGGATAVLAASVSGLGQFDSLASPAGGVAVVLALAVLTGAAAFLVRQPALVPLLILVAAPLRPPIAFDSSGGLPIALAEDGQLGRLLPLYGVLAAAALALLWRALRSDAGAVRALPRAVGIPAAAFIAMASVSLVWADSLETGAELLTYFTLPFAVLLGVVARSPFPEWAPRALARIAVGLAVVFAAVGLYQAITRELFFFSPNVEVSNANSSFFRVTSLFGDPSLYGRHVVLGIGVLLVLLALRRVGLGLGLGLLAVMWLGLLFSYSQSSMVALVAVTLAVAAATGGRGTKRFVLGGLVLVGLLGAGYLASIEIRGESLRAKTADRSQRVQETARVVGEDPLIGVGIAGQPEATRRLADKDRRERSTPNFVSHTTPLTVIAELGVVGLILYLALLAGGVRLIAGVYRLEAALGLSLGAAFLALFVHALFYSGFLEDPLTWVVLGLAAGYLTWPRRDDGVHKTPRDGAAAAAP